MIDCYINNETSLFSLGVYLQSRPCIPANEQEVENIYVPGRDGDLTIVKGWKDREFSLPLNFVEFNNLPKKMREIRSVLLDAKIISFSEDTDVYYKVKRISIGDMQRELSMFGKFTVTFILEPFDYSNDTSILIINSNTSIYNIATHYSKPKLKLYGTGNLQVSINSQTFQINNVTSYVEIDSELQQCHENTLNKEFIGSYPVLEVGENKITKSSNISKIEIDPRWRYR